MMRSVTILIVDDDDMVRSIIREFLISFGFDQLLMARNGNEALKLLKESHQKVDLIISDWEMPQMNGLGLLQAVRRNSLRKSTKFLMVTSQRSQERAKISRAALWKVDAYIIKPFRGEVLKEKVELLLGLLPLDAKKAS